MPNDQGFDYYFGTWGATDSGTVKLMRNADEVEKTSDMAKLAGLYTDEAIKFIKGHKEGPFFVYLAHSMPHIMIDASKQFKGKSPGDLYGDVIEEIDWNTGRLVDTLEEFGLTKDTLVMFASDNGPWCNVEESARKSHGGHQATGSAGPLRGSKASCWEGGVRVPCIFWGPGRIPAGRVNNGIVGTIDLLPTFAALGGGKLPAYGVDGVDQTALLTGQADKSACDRWFYFLNARLAAVRKDQWKLFVKTKELYNLEKDLGERNDAAKENPDKVEELLKLADWAKTNLQRMEAVVGAPKDKRGT
jgi:arylsulfatase